MANIQGNLADGKPMQVGGWYNGQQWDGSKLSAPGTLSNGQKVSNEVISQTNPNNVQYVQQQTQAQDLRAPVNVPYSSGANGQAVNGLAGQVDMYNKQLQDQLAKQQADNQKRLKEAQATQAQGLQGFKDTATGIRQEIDTFAQPMDKVIMQDFEERRKTVGRMEQLLTEGQEYIRQQKGVTGLGSIRNPRINRAIEDVAAEAGILQAYIAGLDGNITQAHSIINNKMGQIMASRQEDLNYYKTIIQLAENDIVRLDADAKRIANEEIRATEKFLDDALSTQNYVKQLMLNPATAGLLNGVRLNMSVEDIQQVVSTNTYSKEVSDMVNNLVSQGNTLVYDPASVPANQLMTLTDSRGQQHYFKKEPKGSGGGIVKAVSYQTPSQRGAATASVGAKKTSSVAPQFSASKGTIWVDPATGIRWISTGQGWKREGS